MMRAVDEGSEPRKHHLVHALHSASASLSEAGVLVPPDCHGNSLIHLAQVTSLVT